MEPNESQVEAFKIMCCKNFCKHQWISAVHTAEFSEHLAQAKPLNIKFQDVKAN